MTDKRHITAEDLYHIQQIGSPQLSPDGRHVIYTVQRIDQKTEKKYRNLWLVPTDGGTPRQFTYGDQSDTMPRWSPDGQQIAFLSNRGNERQPQIYLIPFGGGEARPLTDAKGFFSSLEWSPDGSKLLCVFRKKDQEAIDREADEAKKKLGIVDRHYSRVFFKFDGVGYLPKEHNHIWVFDVDSGEGIQLTDGDKDETSACWSPDGSRILFVSNRAEDPDFSPQTSELYTIPGDATETVNEADFSHIETDHELQKFSPSYSPDGNWIAYLGRRLQGSFWQNSCLYVIPAGGGSASNLSSDFDLHLSSVTGGDIGGSKPMLPPTWSPDSQTIYAQVTHRGNQPLVSFPRDGGIYEIVVGESGVIGEYSFSDDGNKLVYIYADFTDPNQIYVRDMTSGDSTPLTHHNRDLLDELDLGTIEEVWFTNKDGTELNGWILTPPDFDPDQKYPSILQIHGGPMTQYGNHFMHEFYYLAANGYVIYFSNPRGSQGYGEQFAGAIHDNWGTVDYDDVMAWADYMESQPYLDLARRGVTGGSYGGYMTTLIIGRDHRFKAAVAQRLVSNLISMWGTSDFNWIWTRAFGYQTPWENLQNYWRQSPLSEIGNAQTPTLIIHSQADYRANQEQAEQVYVALKKLGVDSEFVLFPDEPHGLSRVGRTDRRIARLNHILRWFDKYLK